MRRIFSVRNVGLSLVAAALCTASFLAPAYAATADEAPAAPVATQAQGSSMLEVSIERIDKLGSPVLIGDVVTFKITYTNKHTSNVTAFPRSSNMSNVAVQGDQGGCRWSNLAPNTPQSCTSGYHVITAEDVANGFTPEVTFDATQDRAGKTVLQAGIKVTGDKIEVKNDTRPHPSESTQEITDGEHRELAGNGLAGFACHRIPALTTATNGWILAAWDGRPDTCQDAPQANSIIGRISKDGGKTWSKPMTIAAGHKGADKYGYSDPSFVVDRVTGEIFVFFVKSFDQGIGGSRLGTEPTQRNVIHAAVTSSTDNGQTWSEPKVITKEITNSPDTEYGRFATSGEGIQLQYGKHAGRLVQQYAMNYAERGLAMKSVSVYSDDHGKTWKAGQPFGTHMDENKVVELSNGDLMVNSRSQGDGVKARKVAISHDGGETYGEVHVDNALIDPNNNASIIRAFPHAAENSACAKILLFSNTAATNGRRNGTIRVSRNNGKTWTTGTVFNQGNMQYSTMTALPEPGTYGMLFEGANSTIQFMKFSLKYLNEDDIECPTTATTETQTEAAPLTADTASNTEVVTTEERGTQTAPEPAETEGNTAQDAATQTEAAETAPQQAEPAKPATPERKIVKVKRAEAAKNLASTGAPVAQTFTLLTVLAALAAITGGVARRMRRTQH